MGVIRTIISAVFDPAFYARVRDLPLRQAFKFYGYIALLISCVIFAGVYVAVIPYASAEFLDKLAAAYPADLVVTIANQQVSINKPEPYYVKNTFGGDPKNLVIFDTKDKLSGDADGNSTYLLVKKKYVITGQNIRQDGNPLAQIKATTTISRSDVDHVVGKVRPYVGPAIIGGGAIMFFIMAVVIAVFIFLGHILYLLIPAAAIFLFTRMRSVPLSFKESYITALYASVPVALVAGIFSLPFIHMRWPIFVYTLLVLLIAMVNTARSGDSAPKS